MKKKTPWTYADAMFWFFTALTCCCAFVAGTTGHENACTNTFISAAGALIFHYLSPEVMP